MMKLEVWTLVPTAVTGRKQFLGGRFPACVREYIVGFSLRLKGLGKPHNKNYSVLEVVHFLVVGA